MKRKQNKTTRFEDLKKKKKKILLCHRKRTLCLLALAATSHHLHVFNEEFRARVE